MPRLYDQRWSCLARLSSTVPQQRIRIKSRTNEENGTKEEEAAGNCRMCLGIARGFAEVACGVFQSRAVLAELGFAGTFWT